MEIKDFLNKKKAVKSSLTRLKNKTSVDFENLQLAELSVRKNRFIKIADELAIIFDEIVVRSGDEEIEGLVEEREELLEIVDEMLAKIDTKVWNCSKSASEKKAMPAISECAEIKLPVLSLPTFSGVLDEFITFSDLFRAAVINNPNLTDAQRLQYLKGVLRGDAHKIVQSLSISDGNFKIAWDLLTERYFHKRDIMSSVMSKLLNLPSLNSESHNNILHLVDSTKEYVRLLETLDLKIEGAADTILMFLVQFKLDSSTRSWWERSLDGDKIPTLNELLQFLSNHSRSLVSKNQGVQKSVSKRVTLVASETRSQCVLCQGNHHLSKCDAFLKMSVQKRVEFVKGARICFNCLCQFHRSFNCKSGYKCRKCQKSHNTLLHFENRRYSGVESQGGVSNSTSLSVSASEFVPSSSVPGNENSGQGAVESGSSGIISCCSDFGSSAQVLLCTAIVKVRDAFGDVQLCRALLDPGSQASLITNKCLDKLRLPRKRANVAISCLGSTDTRTSGVCKIRFSPHFDSNSSFVTSMYVVKKIVGQLPHCSLDPSCLGTFGDMQLADPTFFRSGPIDILLGVDIALPMLRGQSFSLGEGKPMAVRSDLGWIVAGSISGVEAHSAIHVNNIQLLSDRVVEKFWELDSVPMVKLQSREDRLCEEYYVNNHTRGKDGRYIVRLPFHTDTSKIGESKQIALKRLKCVERSLSSKPDVYSQYREFMREYHALGHMEAIPESEYEKSEVYYLPHQAVIRKSSSTTKLRVVFDGSSKSSTGYSLNDLLMVGPRVQPELYPILLRFRTFEIVVCADIEKMFRQIKVHEDDCDWQRILWRESSEEPVREFRLLTVTYGTTSAPFLSTRTLKQLALDEKDEYPLASFATLEHFYVDDLLSGAASESEAIELVRQLKGMMKKGGFNLRKWNSNAPTVLNEILDQSRDENFILGETDSDVKILGIRWSPNSDCMSFTVAQMEEKTKFSKREILSDISRVFDPLGLLAPCVIFMKILIQQLWKCDLTWDQAVPDEMNEKWILLRKELHLIQQLKIPRFVLHSLRTEVELHAFCDASEKAYCAAIYLRCLTSNSEVYVSLLTSKTRVSPLKVQSLPRLELCAALLLSELVDSVQKTIPLPVRETIAWSDSTIALTWLKSEPYRWHTFVANRVSKIQSLIPFVKWCHVRGIENPADFGTRGLLPSELVDCDQWFYGPHWLRQPIVEFSEYEVPSSSTCLEDVLKEEKKLTTCVAKVQSLPKFVENISSYMRLIRVCAWILRFIRNCRSPRSRISSYLTSKELQDSIVTIVRLIQEIEFSAERKCLSEARALPRNSKLLCLNVFLDSNKILRVGGRLSKHVSLSYDQKHPMILPKNHEFTKRVIEYYHRSNFHAGPQLTLALLRQKFWFVDGRSVVRNQLKKCVQCFRLNLRSSPQIMGDLPIHRITQTRPFESIGLDFAGPFYTKCAHKRSVTKFKSYICVFICTAIKAVHLELVSELSTTAFIAALRRFISRRGCPSRIASDNGSNFKGASRYLRDLFLLCKQADVQNFCSEKGIEWVFIPTYTPHFGGLWEAAVKSAKRLMVKTASSALLNFEEVCTLLYQVEACLNSRPLTEMSHDPSDLSALTPAHFLMGGPVQSFPEPVEQSRSLGLSERWRLIQRLRDQFWSRWSTEYLQRLQPRSKWWTSKPNLKVGDMVIVQRENTHPLEWPLGRIVKLFSGADSKVRVVTVNTNQGQMKRSVNKIYLLPIVDT